MSRRSKLWLSTVCGLVCIQALASLILRPGFTLVALTDLLQLFLLLSGILALIPVVLTSRGRPRLFWAFITLGVGFWFAYQVLWCYFEVFLKRDVPNPFAGDAVLFLHLVPMIAALAVQPHVEPDRRGIRLGSLDFATLLVWWLYLYLVTVIPWQYVYQSETLYEHSLNFCT